MSIDFTTLIDTKNSIKILQIILESPDEKKRNNLNKLLECFFNYFDSKTSIITRLEQKINELELYIDNESKKSDYEKKILYDAEFENKTQIDTLKRDLHISRSVCIKLKNDYNILLQEHNELIAKLDSKIIKKRMQISKLMTEIKNYKEILGI